MLDPVHMLKLVAYTWNVIQPSICISTLTIKYLSSLKVGISLCFFTPQWVFIYCAVPIVQILIWLLSCTRLQKFFWGRISHPRWLQFPWVGAARQFWHWQNSAFSTYCNWHDFLVSLWYLCCKTAHQQVWQLYLPLSRYHTMENFRWWTTGWLKNLSRPSALPH